jgi:hypothetical protein
MTGPRNVAAVVSIAALCTAVGCTNFYEIPIETPIQPKMDVTPFTRVLVAGFISGGTDDVDGNLETVRLLRSQLRSKSNLRVIEAEVLPLADIARDQMKANAVAPAPVPNGDHAGTPAAAETTSHGGSSQPITESGGHIPVQAPQAPVASPQGGEGGQQVQPVPALPVPPDAGEDKIRNEKDLERYQKFFENAEFWKKLGQEHQNPLIVTGTVLFTNTQSSGFVTQNREIIDPLGRRVVQPYRTYMERKGFIIEPRFIFIDGRTGAVLYSDRFHEEILYPAQQQTPPLSSYFELMDRLIPSFLGSLSTQRIRGTRVLLK